MQEIKPEKKFKWKTRGDSVRFKKAEKKIQVKHVDLSRFVYSDHLHGREVGRYYSGMAGDWFCRFCSQKVTDLPLIAVVYKRKIKSCE